MDELGINYNNKKQPSKKRRRALNEKSRAKRKMLANIKLGGMVVKTGLRLIWKMNEIIGLLFAQKDALAQR